MPAVIPFPPAVERRRAFPALIAAHGRRAYFPNVSNA